MATEKITKRMKFEMLLPLVADNAMLTDFIKHEMDLLARKNEKGETAPTKEQKIMAELMDVVEGAMTALEKPATVSEILLLPEVKAYGADNEKFAVGITPQRMTSCLHKLVKEGKVVRTEKSGKTLFSLAD